MVSPVKPAGARIGRLRRKSLGKCSRVFPRRVEYQNMRYFVTLKPFHLPGTVICLEPDGEWIYWCPHCRWNRVPTHALRRLILLSLWPRPGRAAPPDRASRPSTFSTPFAPATVTVTKRTRGPDHGATIPTDQPHGPDGRPASQPPHNHSDSETTTRTVPNNQTQRQPLTYTQGK